LDLLVENNKVSSINKEETMGIGIKNATSRLEHLYAGKHRLTIENTGKYFSVNLQIDLND
jgi:LytS/YehU family sensor histidine kinase